MSTNEDDDNYTLPSIRSVVTERDGLSKEEIDELFEEAREDLQDGVEPDEVLAGVFGLEPDFVFDSEFLTCIDGVFPK